ncbi:MAG TPA: PP2C family serine/threonine-protein phosphatase [Terrimicrobiaceae bacterium]
MWNVLGTSVTGVSHLRSGIPCQDYSAHELLNRGKTAVIALSDGAGSASHSHLGSKIAVKAALSALKQVVESAPYCDRDGAHYVLDAARTAVIQSAGSFDRRAKDFACTLLFCVASESRASFVQLGDGAWIVMAGGNLFPMTWPLQGEYANETNFLTSANWREGFEFRETSFPINAMAGFTDGLQMVALHYASRSVHEPFFAPLFKVLASSLETSHLLESLAGYLSVEALNERTDDDKTLVLAVRRNLPLLTWSSSTTKTFP